MSMRSTLEHLIRVHEVRAGTCTVGQWSDPVEVEEDAEEPV